MTRHKRRVGVWPAALPDVIDALDKCHDYNWRPVLPGERPLKSRVTDGSDHAFEWAMLDIYVDSLFRTITSHHTRNG